MSTTITETGPFERLVKFRLTEEEIAAGKAATARKLSQDLKLPGFRPGRAPLPVVEAAVGADRLRSEVIDDLVPPTLTQVLTEEEISPAVTPQLESLNDVDGGVDVEVRVTLWPTIELPTYKGRDIQVTSPVVTEEEMEAQVTRMLEQFATVEEVERAAEVGDFVSIDISANSGEDQVPEATAADLLYEIGSSVFIEGMDDRLAGARARDSVEFDAPLPPGFGERAGEPVQFKVTVNEVKERILPELDDAWVDENTEFETVEELYAELREGLSEAKRQAVSRQFAERALSTLVDQVEVDLPDGLIRAEMDNHMHRFLHRLQENELTLDDYFRVSGVDQETFVDDLRAQAELSLRNQLVLEALAEAEGIEVTEEDISSTLRALATQSGDPVAYLRAFRESGRELALASDILRNRALDVVFSNANPVDEDGNPIDLSLQVTEVEAEVVEAEPIEVEAVIAEVVEEEE
ncbi:MAG TPA: trigger factor [Acidimicrobiia bacterium]|nr:trigger factor [Acidimicrobiia bacterium]